MNKQDRVAVGYFVLLCILDNRNLITKRALSMRIANKFSWVKEKDIRSVIINKMISKKLIVIIDSEELDEIPGTKYLTVPSDGRLNAIKHYLKGRFFSKPFLWLYLNYRRWPAYNIYRVS